MPALLAIVLGLVLFLAFVLQRSGRSPALGTLILVAFGLLPVVAVQAPELVPAVAFYLVRSGAVAVLWVWLLHALLPDPEAAASRAPDPGGAAAPPGEVVRSALTDTAVLLPVLLVAMTLEVAGGARHRPHGDGDLDASTTSPAAGGWRWASCSATSWAASRRWSPTSCSPPCRRSASSRRSCSSSACSTPV